MFDPVETRTARWPKLIGALTFAVLIAIVGWSLRGCAGKPTRAGVWKGSLGEFGAAGTAVLVLEKESFGRLVVESVDRADPVPRPVGGELKLTSNLSYLTQCLGGGNGSDAWAFEVYALSLSGGNISFKASDFYRTKIEVTGTIKAEDIDGTIDIASPSPDGRETVHLQYPLRLHK